MSPVKRNEKSLVKIVEHKLEENFYNASDFESEKLFKKHDFEEKNILKSTILEKNKFLKSTILNKFFFKTHGFE